MIDQIFPRNGLPSPPSVVDPNLFWPSVDVRNHLPLCMRLRPLAAETLLHDQPPSPMLVHGEPMTVNE